MSTTTKFYRIENRKTKIGPYRSIVEIDRFPYKTHFLYVAQEEAGRELSTSMKNCPTPSMEGISTDLYRNDKARYGFPSLSKLRKWFGTSKKLYACMEKYDFVLRVYTVESGSVFKSPTQCIVMIGDLVEYEELPFSVIYEKKA